MSAGVFEYDARIYGYEWNPIEDVVNNFLNKAAKKDDIYKAIHIFESFKNPKYTPSSEEVAEAYDMEENDDYTNYYSYML